MMFIFTINALWLYNIRNRPSSRSNHLFLCLQMTFDILTSFYFMLLESKMSFYLALIAMTLNVIQLCLWLRLRKSLKPEREPLVTRNQGVSTSTCCGAGVLQLLLSHLSPTEPPPEINMEEEMKQPYMVAFREEYGEEEYPQEKVVAAIKYMNTLRGGKSQFICLWDCPCSQRDSIYILS